MIYGSVCSGIEAASAAWEPLGWRAAWFAEIEPFPCAVLAHHYPDVPNLGDISAADFTDRAMGLDPIDVLVGGTPCQAFSVAGKRRSLQDDRGNLALVFCRIVERIDPWCVLWENVPGVLSTSDNAFGYFLAGLVGAPAPLVPGNPASRWPDAGLVRGPRRSAAWGILDAQHFGLAQRRRRVFVASLRADDWRCPAAILFEPYGLSRHLAQGREAEPGVAPSVTPGARRASGNRGGELLTAGFQANGSGSFRAGPISLAASDDNGSNQLISHTLRGEGFDASEDGTGRGTPLVPVLSPTLFASSGGASSGYHPVIPIDMRQTSRGEIFTNKRAEGSSGGAPGTGIGEAGDPAPSLSLSHPPAVAFAWQGGGKQTSLGFDPESDTSQTISAHQTPGIAFQCHGSNVGPMGTIRSGNGNTAGGVPFVVNAAESTDRVKVAVCDTRTGETVFDDQWDALWWMEGNGSCDCNRARLFGHPNVREGYCDGCVRYRIVWVKPMPEGCTIADFNSGYPDPSGSATPIAFQERGRDGGPNLEYQSDRAYSLNAPSGGGRRQEMNVAAGMAVRRLMPVECERLQGFPDGYTDVPFKGKPAADGSRYRAIGNSKAVTVVRWLGQRMDWLRGLTDMHI